MKQRIKGIFSIILAAMMAFAIPITAFAEGDASMSLVINTEAKCYAGVTYDVIATVVNLTEDAVIGNEASQSEFSWQTADGETISTTNDYKIVEQDNGKYAVTETAKVVLPESLGTTTITASYGSITKSINIERHQPITGISIIPQYNGGSWFYKGYDDSSMDVLYIDHDTTAVLDLGVSPDNHEDSLVVSRDEIIFNDIYFTPTGIKISPIDKRLEPYGMELFYDGIPVSKLESNIFVLAPKSGYKVTKKFNVYVCYRCSSFGLFYNDSEVGSSTKREPLPPISSTEASNITSGVNIVAGDSVTIVPKGNIGQQKGKPIKEITNDGIEYELYNNLLLQTDPLSYYMTVSEEDESCTLTISNPGTYYLKAYTVSPGGYLNRDQVAFTKIVVNEPNPITDIKLYQLTDDKKLDKNSPLEEITLYTESKKQYNLSENVSILPDGYSHKVKYTSEDPEIAYINPDTGVITAKSSGETTVSVYSERNPDVITSCKVKVIKEIVSIDRITAETLTVPQGHAVQLTAVITPEDSNEKIRWASQNPDAFSITADGYGIANPDYDLNGADKLRVLVTATSESGKQQQQIITIVPAIPSTVVNVSAAGAGANQDLFRPDLQIENTYTTFEGEPFLLSAIGKNDDGTPTNEVFRWVVAYNNEEQFDIEPLDSDTKCIVYRDDHVTKEKIFEYVYDKNIDTYTVTPAKTGNYTFFCYSVKRGQSPTKETVFGTAVVKVVGKAKSISVYNPKNDYLAYTSDCIPTGDSIDISFSMTPLDSEINDPAILTSSDESIARVVKTSDTTATITAGKIQGNANITIRSTSGNAYTVFRVTVSNNINFADVYNVEPEYEYTGRDIKPVPVLKYNDKELKKNIDYSIDDYSAYRNCKNVGMASLTISGKGNFNKSTKVVYYSIIPKAINDKEFQIACTTEVMQVSAENPAPVPDFQIIDSRNGDILRKDVDYTVEAINNTTSGTATAIITGIGNYSGIVKRDYMIGGSISSAVVSAISNQKYTGKEIKPSVKVVLDGRELKKNVDYTVSYANNIAIGKAKVVITGKGGYSDTKTVYFNIIPPGISGLSTAKRTSSSIKLKWNSNTNVTGYQIYDVSSKKIVKTITNKTTNTYTVTKLSIMKPYSYKIRAYKTVGGVNYYGSYSAVHYTYTIPKTPTVTLKTGSKYVNVTWKKISSVSGYQVQFSTSQNFGSAKTYKVSASATSKKFTKLKKGKKYYVRVRAYRTLTVGGKKTTAYSEWKKASITCK